MYVNIFMKQTLCTASLHQPRALLNYGRTQNLVSESPVQKFGPRTFNQHNRVDRTIPARHDEVSTARMNFQVGRFGRGAGLLLPPAVGGGEYCQWP